MTSAASPRVEEALPAVRRPALLLILALASAGGLGACSASGAAPTASSASGAPAPPLKIADELERLIAQGKATETDRRAAYEQANRLQAASAEDALGRAMLAGRLAQLKGLGAPGLVKEVERYARRSAELDPTLRSGAAWRILGTLYVMAPASLVSHGDSETGLELLERVVERWPDHPQNHLRLAEAYLALGDAEPAPPHLCFCRARQQQLTPDDRRLLDELFEEAELASCP